MTLALRDSLGQVIDKVSKPNPAKAGEMIETFAVNPTKLSNWKKKPGSQRLMQLVDGLAEDLTDETTAKKAFDNMLSDAQDQISPTRARQLGFNDEQMEALYDTKAFQWTLQYEDPGKAVANALSADRPSLALNSLYRIAKETDLTDSGFSREQVLSGLKSAMINNALVKSNNQTGLPNGNVLQKTIFGQMEGVDPSVKFSMEDFMLQKGLSTKEEMETLQKAVKTLRGVEEAYASGDFENVLFKNPSLAKLFYLRIAGATAGSAVQNKMMSLLGLPRMSGGLIAEQTGSEIVQKLLLKGPETQRIKVMTELFSNPKALSAAMKTIKTSEDLDKTMAVLEKTFEVLTKQIGRRIPLGIRAADEALTEEYETPEQAPAVQPPLPNPVPPAPATPQQPPPQMQQQPPPQGAAPPPQAVVSSGPVDRAKFAALFPEDRELMGIGSLMGAA
tara:strand:- start:10885 stop:12225 length:1341 start_codon:yes stop_codon:yes gene_type:complete